MTENHRTQRASDYEFQAGIRKVSHERNDPVDGHVKADYRLG